MPVSVLEQTLRIAGDEDLRKRIESRGITKDRSWATEYAQDVFREMCRDKLRLPTRDELEEDVELRRKAAAIVSYVLAEGSIWLQKERFGEHAVNITFANHEEDLYAHFRGLCNDVFGYDIGPSQRPGNGANAIRGFIYSRFVAEWLAHNGARPGEKSSMALRLPRWVLDSSDGGTLISALQPWFDGEGHVILPQGTGRAAFSLVQSKHTNLDFDVLGYSPLDVSGRTLSGASLRSTHVWNMPIHDYMNVFCRSEVFDDVYRLLTRIGMTPRMSVTSLSLKNDGFWSCLWNIKLGASQTQELVELGILTQKRKVAAVLSRIR